MQVLPGVHVAPDTKAEWYSDTSFEMCWAKLLAHFKVLSENY